MARRYGSQPANNGSQNGLQPRLFLALRVREYQRPDHEQAIHRNHHRELERHRELRTASLRIKPAMQILFP
jgi:hypothetical protein